MGQARYLSLPVERWPALDGHLPSLDGLRAVSISIVLAGHFLLPASLAGISALGVKIFFFISGFLITRLLLAEHKAVGGINLGGFYIRRLLRLYPVLIVYTTLAVIVTTMRGLSFNPVDALSVFLYFVNYQLGTYELVGQQMTLPVGVLWSLSVEEHFYLFAPLALVLARGNVGRMMFVAVGVAVLPLCLRLLYAWHDPSIVDTMVIYKHSETRFDSIAFGVMLACLTETTYGLRVLKLLTTRLALIAGLAVLAISFLVRDNYFESTWRFTVQGLALFPLIAALVFAQPVVLFNRLLNSPPAVWMGKLSYSLYVWHGGVLFFFGWAIGGLTHWPLAAAELILTFLMAIASYYVIERPVLGLRRHFRHGHRHAVDTQPSPRAIGE